jgi:proteasome activator subunit 4
MPVLNDESSLSWEPESLPCLDVIREVINEEGYIDQLAILWSQESGKSSNTLGVRPENPLFFKYLCM